MRHELTYPDAESDLYRTYRRLCMQHLLDELTDCDGHSVIGYATHNGAVAMLNVSRVYWSSGSSSGSSGSGRSGSSGSSGSGHSGSIDWMT